MKGTNMRKFMTWLTMAAVALVGLSAQAGALQAVINPKTFETYPSIEAALKATTNGDRLLLLRDSTEQVYLDAVSKATLDLNNLTWSNGVNNAGISCNNAGLNVVISNGTFSGDLLVSKGTVEVARVTAPAGATFTATSTGVLRLVGDNYTKAEFKDVAGLSIRDGQFATNLVSRFDAAYWTKGGVRTKELAVVDQLEGKYQWSVRDVSALKAELVRDTEPTVTQKFVNVVTAISYVKNNETIGLLADYTDSSCEISSGKEGVKFKLNGHKVGQWVGQFYIGSGAEKYVSILDPVDDDLLIFVKVKDIIAQFKEEPNRRVFTSLSNALYKAAATNATVQVIKNDIRKKYLLPESTLVTESVVITNSCALDLNGHTLTGAYPDDGTNSVISLADSFGGDFTLYGGTLGGGNLDLGGYGAAGGTVAISNMNLVATDICCTNGTAQITVGLCVTNNFTQEFSATNTCLSIDGIGSLFSYNQNAFRGEGVLLAHNTNATTKAQGYEYVVVPTNTPGLVQLIKKDGTETQEYFIRGKDALSYAGTERGDTLKLLHGQYPSDGFHFSDEELQKCLRFDLNGATLVQDKFVAERHAEFYEARFYVGKEPTKVIFSRKNPQTRRLWFVVEGAGSVEVDSQPVDHNKSGLETVVDFAEVTEGPLTIKGVPIPNGGDEQLAWYTNTFKTAEGADLTVEEIVNDPTKGTWVPMTYDARTEFELSPYFVELESSKKADHGYVLKVAFRKAPITRGTLTVRIEPPCAAGWSMKLDDKTLRSWNWGASFVQWGLKADSQHALAVTPLNKYLSFVTWYTNGVPASTGTTFYPYDFKETATVVARFSSIGTFACTNVVKTYDGQPTNIVVNVNGLDDNARVEYSLDMTNWTTSVIAFTNATPATNVYWRVKDKTDFFRFIQACGTNTVTINRLTVTPDATVTWGDYDRFYDGTGKEPTIDKITSTNGVELSTNEFYIVRYENNVNISNGTAVVTFTNNAQGVAAEIPYAFPILPRPLTSAKIDRLFDHAFLPEKVIRPSVLEVKADPLTLTTNDYDVIYRNNTGWSMTEPAEVVVTGKVNFCGAITNKFTICQTIPKWDNGRLYGLYYANRLLDEGDVVKTVLATVTTNHSEYVVSNFVQNTKTYKVVGILPGAFTNSAPTLWNIKINEKETELFGNIIWGLEKLQYIDFPGAKYQESPYYYQKLGLDYSGAGVLVKSNKLSAPYDAAAWNDVTLLGVAGAADVFEVSNVVTRIAATAFAGNTVLKEIALHNGIAADGLATNMVDYLNVKKTIFTMDEEPNEALTNAVAALELMWYPDGNRWITKDASAAEAMIITPSGLRRYYMNIKNAVLDARDGETIYVLTNIVKDAKHPFLTVDGKRVLFNARGWSVLGPLPIHVENGGEFGILAGTYDRDYEHEYAPDNYLVPGVFWRPTMMWDNYQTNGTWTVVDESSIRAKYMDSDPVHKYLNEAIAIADNDSAAKISGRPTRIYNSLTTAMAGARFFETVTLLRDVAERIVVDTARVNTIDLGGQTWACVTPAPMSLPEAALALTASNAFLRITNGSVAGPLYVESGRVVLDNVTAKPNFFFIAQKSTGGAIAVESGNYLLAQTNDISGVTVRGGTFGHDFDATGNFDSQDGLNAFVRIGARAWEVRPANTVVARIGDQEYDDIYLALDLAQNDDVVEIVKPVDDTLVLRDEVILKNLVFRNKQLLWGNPKLAAERHAEKYSVVELPDGGIQLLHNDLPTRKLTFIIEGAGRAYVDGVDARHVKDGTQTVEDYSEIKQGRVVTITGVPEKNGGDVFWRFEDVNGNRLYKVETDDAIDPYGSSPFRVNSIRFKMPYADTTIRLVFLPKEQVTTHTVSVTVEPVAALATSDYTVDTRAPFSSSGVRTKNGDHLLTATNRGDYAFCCWVTNGVVASTNARWDGFQTVDGVLTNTAMARFVPTNFYAWVETNLVEKTYDGKATNIVVYVENLDGTLPYGKEYSTDGGTTWTTVCPTFTDATAETGTNVLWRIVYGTPKAEIESGMVTVIIHKKNLEDDDVNIRLAERWIVWAGHAVKPDVLIDYAGMRLSTNTDFFVEYEGNEDGCSTAYAHVYARNPGNYCVTNLDGYVERDFNVLGTFKKDGVTYYRQDAEMEIGHSETGRVAAVVSVSTVVPVNENGVYVVPNSVRYSGTTYTVIDIVPGAFTNIADRVKKLDLSACGKVNLWGNIIWGLEKLEDIDFPGTTWTDSPYYYSKLGERYNGAGVLVKSGDTEAPYSFETNLTLLGVADAGDTFEVSNCIKRIAQTAFAGNPLLKKIVLHNGLEEIEEGFTKYLDTEHVAFETRWVEPSQTLKDIFGREGLTWVRKADRTGWTTFAWANAEAKIVTPSHKETYYNSFADAVARARDGETVTVLRDLIRETREAVTIADGKQVIIDAEGFKLLNIVLCTVTSDDDLRIAAGTYDIDYSNFLVATTRYPNPVMVKWYDTDAKAWRWTVVNGRRPAAVRNGTYFYKTIADAVKDANPAGGDTVAVTNRFVVREDLIVDKSLTFTFTKGSTWIGTLVASNAIVNVEGYRSTVVGSRTFGVLDNGSVLFNYSPAQTAVKDASYAIFRIAEEPATWQLLLAGNETGRDTFDADELFTDLNVGAACATNLTVTKDMTAQNITAKQDFTIQTSNDVVYAGWIDPSTYSVMTVEGSVFKTNLIDVIDWANSGDGNLTLAYNYGRTDGTYTVVKKGKVVARFVWDDGKKTVEFSDAKTAIASLDHFKPVDCFEIGVNDTGCTYDFSLDVPGAKGVKDETTFKSFVNVSTTATNTIQNVVLGGESAVTGATGTVVFDFGVRMTNEVTKFKTGDVKLIVRKGAYVNDPQISTTEYLEPGYSSARRAKTGSELDGYYVIYSDKEIAATVTKDGHHIHYKTLQDAFTKADSGAKIQLFNNGSVEETTTVPAGKTFTLTADAQGAGAQKPAANITGGTITIKGELIVDGLVTNAASFVVDGGKLTITNVVIDTAAVIAKNGGSVTVADVTFDGANAQITADSTSTVTIGDGVAMRNVANGAIVMAAGSKLYVDTTEANIIDNPSADAATKMNVVLANAEILVLKKDKFMGTIGLYMADFQLGTKFEGLAFGAVSDGVTYPDGDISYEEIRFVNDRNVKMTTGLCTALADKLGEGYTRYVNGFKDVLSEGKKLLLRTGNKLVWLTMPSAPVDDVLAFVGRTAYTLTITPKTDDVYGRDYAVVAGAPAETNWVSMTSESLAWNGADQTFTFTNLAKNTCYTLLTRRSISMKNTVSGIVALGPIWTAKYDAMEIAQMFYENVSETLPKVTDLSERAGNDEFLEVTTAGNQGNGYVVSLKRDLNRGAVIKDDAAKILLKMNGNYLNAQVAPTQNGIRFEEGVDYNAALPTDLTVENNTLVKPGRIVGAIGANGTDAFDGANGTDGAAGITNASANKVTLTLKGGVEVYGGKGGNGANRTDVAAGNGGKGGDAIVGIINLSLEGAKLTGGNGGNGGDSTYAKGGNGGAGGAGVGQLVTGSITSGEVYGGQGGNGGASGQMGVTGDGGKGGDSLVNIGAMIGQGGDFTDDIVLQPGKGGEGSTRGEDGTGARPAAPAAATVKYVGGDFVTLNVEPKCEYLVFATTNGAPSEGQQHWILVPPDKFELMCKPLYKGTDYTVWARKPATDNTFASFYASSTFKTLNYNRDDLWEAFDRSVQVEVVAGHYLVQMTRDIEVGVLLPDDIGTFTLDMGGWTIKGPDAVAPGQDGKPAIAFYKNGNGDTDPNHTTKILISGNGKNQILGGNGAHANDAISDGNADNGGQGGFGFGIDKSEGTPATVTVVLTDGIVRGGNGGNGGSTVNGIAGNGGDGGSVYDAAFIDFVYEGGQLFGGDGGKGGDAVGGTAGDGGNGGDASEPAINVGEGGAGGLGGKANDKANWGENGDGGEGAIPGGMPRAYVARIDGIGCKADGDFYTSFQDAVSNAVNGGTLTIVRDTVFDGAAEVTVTASDLTLKTAPGVMFTWNGEIRLASGVLGLKFEEDFAADPSSTGTLTVEDWADATIKGGFVPELYVCADGSAEAKGGEIGNVTVEDEGIFEVPGDSTAVIGAILDENGCLAAVGDFLSTTGVFLRGGEYTANPSAYVVDPFEAVTNGNNWKIQPDPRYTAMVVAGGKAWAVETMDEAFTAVSKATGLITVYLLKDSVGTIPLTDQDATDVIIYGDGHAITDKRQEKACEDALFNLSGSALFMNVVFKGDGQKGQFLRIFKKSEQIKFSGCTITGYACEEYGHVKVELISAWSAGQATPLVLFDTVITNNDVSCAISTCDRSAGGFKYPLYLGGAVTITESGNGIVSDGPGQIIMAHDLTGGWIDVVYAGQEQGRFATAASDMLAGAECFRWSDKKSCGKIDVDGGKYYVKWATDERQYAAKIGAALYDMVEEAFGAVVNGDTLVLMNDAIVEKSTVVRLGRASESFTLDLNGKTLTNDGNKLKFGTGRVTIKNGTLASKTKYAVYAYGAAVTLAGNLDVTSGVYVAKGSLVVPQGENVKVAGVVQALNTGSIMISGGVYTLNPFSYVASGKSVAMTGVEPYIWTIVDATVVTGFANGYTVDTKPDAEGKIRLDFTGSDAVGVLRTDAKITIDGNVTNNLTVASPKGWIARVAYDALSGKTGVAFEMDEAYLKPEMGTDDPGERPLEIVSEGGQVAQVTMHVKNGRKGFWYNLKQADDLASGFTVVTSAQATENGNVSLTVKSTTAHFFTIEVSDRNLKK